MDARPADPAAELRGTCLEAWGPAALVLAGLPAEPFPFWCAGDGQAVFAAAVLERAPQALPVFLDPSAERLFAVRARLGTPAAMGFRCEPGGPDWDKDLPRPPALVAAFFLLSGIEDARKETFLSAALARLRPEGLLLWGDLFLPQTLETLDAYDRELARRAGGGEAALAAARARRAALHPAPSLLERSLGLLERLGYGNVEIVDKRLCYALLAARK